MEGGRNSRRKEFDTNLVKFNCTFTFNNKQYDLFAKFYQDWLDQKGASGLLVFFDMLLIWQPVNPEYPLNNFKCAFLSDPVKITNPDGLSITVSFTIQGYLDQQWPMSALYPLQSTDLVSVHQPIFVSASMWEIPVDVGPQIGGLLITGGVITEYGTITYAPPQPDEGPQIGGLVLTGGAIVEYGTITYNAGVDTGPQIGGLVLTGGEIKEYPTIVYGNYEPEFFAIGGLTITGGVLT